MPEAAVTFPPSATVRALGAASCAAGEMVCCALTVPGRPGHVRSGRDLAARALRWSGRGDDGTVGLLVSELMTNSLLHSDSGDAGGTITVTVTVMPGRVLVDVTDDGGDSEPVLCPAADADGDAENGRGLRLVDELADDWGYQRRDGRLTTWFELRTADQQKGPR